MARKIEIEGKQLCRMDQKMGAKALIHFCISPSLILDWSKHENTTGQRHERLGDGVCKNMGWKEEGQQEGRGTTHGHHKRLNRE